MSIKYKSRSGKLYYLHIGKTKKGNDKYFFSSKKDGDMAQQIPKGYEIYENVNAQVFLRKVQPKLILNQELTIIKKELLKHTKLSHYKYEAKGNIVTVYQINQKFEDLKEIFPFSIVNIDNLLLEKATYSPILRFHLNDKEKRLFSAERFCFLGSIDDFIYIGNTDSLEKLAKKYIKHLGKESFYELD